LAEHQHEVGALVCLDEQLARSRVLEALGRLAEQGLVVPDDYESAQRWRMLDPIWHFAAQCLAEAGEQELVRRRHAEFFAELAERAEPEIRAGAQSVKLEGGRKRVGMVEALVDAEVGLLA